MVTLFTLLGQLFSLIPGLTNLGQTFLTKAFDAKVAIYQAKTGADKEVATQAIRSLEVEKHEGTERLKVIAGNKVLLCIVVGFAAPLILYWCKAIGYDKAICSMLWTPEEIAAASRCSTDPIKGDLAGWANTIIGSLFVSATSMTGLSMYLNRKGA
jgi:hypothetical protein